MKHFMIILSLGFMGWLPFYGTAQDTIGKNIRRIQTITQTTVFVEKAFDSIVGADSALIPQTVTILTYDTVNVNDTSEKTEVEYTVVGLDSLRWQLGTEFSIGVNQVGFVNWAKGGVPSYSILFANKSYANYRHELSSWKTDFEMKYGLQQQASDPWYKNDDQIKIHSVYGFKASEFWNYGALMDFQTQLTKGYASVTDTQHVSNFISPMYLTFSVGMEYENAAKTASIFLTPIAYKLTYVSDTTLGHHYGIVPNRHALSQFGPMAVFANKHKLTKNISVDSKLTFLADMLAMQDPFVTVEWNMGININITRNLRVRLLMDMIYDPKTLFIEEDGTSARKVQFRESVFLNFVYRITN